MSANHILADIGNSAIKLKLSTQRAVPVKVAVSVPRTWYVASVAPDKTKLLADWLREHRPQDTLRLITYHDVPMRVAVTSPARLGIDRLLAAFAATQEIINSEYHSLLVVDAGTALTVDIVRVIKKKPVFVGGAICLGMAPTLIALHTHASQLPHITPSQLVSQITYPAKNTQAAMIAGVIAQSVGAITLLHKKEAKHAKSSKTQVPIVLTGGDAKVLEKPLREACGNSVTIILCPDLVLEGIALVANQLTK